MYTHHQIIMHSILEIMMKISQSELLPYRLVYATFAKSVATVSLFWVA